MEQLGMDEVETVEGILLVLDARARVRAATLQAKRWITAELQLVAVLGTIAFFATATTEKVAPAGFRRRITVLLPVQSKV